MNNWYVIKKFYLKKHLYGIRQVIGNDFHKYMAEEYKEKSNDGDRAENQDKLEFEKYANRFLKTKLVFTLL